jgi:tetratricopeptide (TPR) repeat protein
MTSDTQINPLESQDLPDLRRMLPDRSGLDLSLFHLLLTSDFSSDVIHDPADICKTPGKIAILFSEDEGDDGHFAVLDHCTAEQIFFQPQENLSHRRYEQSLICVDGDGFITIFLADFSHQENGFYVFARPSVIHSRKKRFRDRIPANGEITIHRSNQESIVGKLKDLSNSGVGLLIDDCDLQSGEMILVDFTLPGSDPFTSAALVVRQEKHRNRRYGLFIAARFLLTRSQKSGLDAILRHLNDKMIHPNLDLASSPPDFLEMPTPAELPDPASEQTDTPPAASESAPLEIEPTTLLRETPRASVSMMANLNMATSYQANFASARQQAELPIHPRLAQGGERGMIMEVAGMPPALGFAEEPNGSFAVQSPETTDFPPVEQGVALDPAATNSTSRWEDEEEPAPMVDEPAHSHPEETEAVAEPPAPESIDLAEEHRAFAGEPPAAAEANAELPEIASTAHDAELPEDEEEPAPMVDEPAHSHLEETEAVAEPPAPQSIDLAEEHRAFAGEPPAAAEANAELPEIASTAHDAELPEDEEDLQTMASAAAAAAPTETPDNILESISETMDLPAPQSSHGADEHSAINKAATAAPQSLSSVPYFSSSSFVQGSTMPETSPFEANSINSEKPAPGIPSSGIQRVRTQVELASVLCSKAELLAETGDHRRAVESFDHALTVLGQTQDAAHLAPKVLDIRARSLLGRARSLHTLGDGRALEAAGQAIDALGAHWNDDKALRPQLAIDLAQAHMIRGTALATRDAASAVPEYQRAQEILSVIQKRYGEQVAPALLHQSARTALCLGNLYADQGLYAGALPFLDQAIELSEKTASTLPESVSWALLATKASALLQKSNVLFLLGREDEAMQLTTAGIQAWQHLQGKLGEEFTSDQKAELGAAHLLQAKQLANLGLYTLANQAAEQARQVYVQLEHALGDAFSPKMRLELADIHLQESNATLEQGNAPKALQHAQESVEILQKLEKQLGQQFSLAMRDVLGTALLALGKAQGALGNNRAAFEAMEKAQKLLVG